MPTRSTQGKKDDAPANAPRIALVTGAAKGIGLEIARGLAERGHVVYLTARDAKKAKAAADAMKSRAASRVDVRPLTLDVTDADSIRAAAAHVERESGRLDVLVNNAGILLDEEETALTATL